RAVLRLIVNSNFVGTGMAGFCARAASGNAAAPPPTILMKSRRLTFFPRPWNGRWYGPNPAPWNGTKQGGGRGGEYARPMPDMTLGWACEGGDIGTPPRLAPLNRAHEILDLDEVASSAAEARPPKTA